MTPPCSKKSIKASLGGALMFVSASASAACTYAPGDNSNYLKCVVDSFYQGAMEKLGSNPLLGFGTEMLAILFSIMIVWTLVKQMMIGRGVDSVITEVFPLILSTCIAYFLMVGINGVNAPKLASMFIDSVALKLMSGSDYIDSSSASIGSIVSAPIVTIFETIKNIWKDVAASLGQLSLWKGMENFSILITIVYKAVAAVITIAILIVAAGLFMANLIYSQFMFLIASAFMPLFVPLMIFAPLSGLFDSWLQFTLTALFTKLVGLLTLSLFDGLIAAMAAGSVVGTPNTSGEALVVNILQAAIVIILAFTLMLIMQKSNDIAGQLIGKGVSGFKGFAEVTRSAEMKGITGGLKAGGSSLGSAAASVGAGAAAGGRAAVGAYNAINGRGVNANAGAAERAGAAAVSSAKNSVAAAGLSVAVLGTRGAAKAAMQSAASSASSSARSAAQSAVNRMMGRQSP